MSNQSTSSTTMAGRQIPEPSNKRSVQVAKYNISSPYGSTLGQPSFSVGTSVRSQNVAVLTIRVCRPTMGADPRRSLSQSP